MIDEQKIAGELVRIAKDLTARTSAFKSIKKKLSEANRGLKALDDGSRAYEEAWDKLMEAHDAFDEFRFSYDV